MGGPGSGSTLNKKAFRLMMEALLTGPQSMEQLAVIAKVHERTIYRYLLTLAEEGFPIFRDLHNNVHYIKEVPHDAPREPTTPPPSLVQIETS